MPSLSASPSLGFRKAELPGFSRAGLQPTVMKRAGAVASAPGIGVMKDASRGLSVPASGLAFASKGLSRSREELRKGAQGVLRMSGSKCGCSNGNGKCECAGLPQQGALAKRGLAMSRKELDEQARSVLRMRGSKAGCGCSKTEGACECAGLPEQSALAKRGLDTESVQVLKRTMLSETRLEMLSAQGLPALRAVSDAVVTVGDTRASILNQPTRSIPPSTPANPAPLSTRMTLGVNAGQVANPIPRMFDAKAAPAARLGPRHLSSAPGVRMARAATGSPSPSRTGTARQRPAVTAPAILSRAAAFPVHTASIAPVVRHGRVRPDVVGSSAAGRAPSRVAPSALASRAVASRTALASSRTKLSDAQRLRQVQMPKAGGTSLQRLKLQTLPGESAGLGLGFDAKQELTTTLKLSDDDILRAAREGEFVLKGIKDSFGVTDDALRAAREGELFLHPTLEIKDSFGVTDDALRAAREGELFFHDPTLFGNLTPQQGIYAPEFASARCTNPTGVAQLVIGAGAGYIRGPSNLGAPFTPNDHDLLKDRILCTDGSGAVHDAGDRYTSTWDTDIARLPDGRLVHVGLYTRREVSPDATCQANMKLDWFTGLIEVERALVIRVSDDCGENWPHVQVVHASTIGGEPAFTPYYFLDRPNLYVDLHRKMMYVTVGMGERMWPPDPPDCSSTPTGCSRTRTVVLAASTEFVKLPDWGVLASFTSPGVPVVVSSNPDEFPDLLWLFHCEPGGRMVFGFIPGATTITPLASVAASELVEIDFGSLGPPGRCKKQQDPDPFAPSITAAKLVNVMPQISLAPLMAPTTLPSSSQLPQQLAWRLVYPSVRERTAGIQLAEATGTFQVAEFADIFVEYNISYGPISPPRAGWHAARGTNQPVHVSDPRYRGGVVWAVDESWHSRHVLWPDLLWPRGAETNPAYRYQHVLNWVEVDENLTDFLGGLLGQRVMSQAWYPDSVYDAWDDPRVLRESWIYAAALAPPNYSETTGQQSHFFGDYKYGTFIGDDDLGAHYFVPWNETVVDKFPPTYPMPNAQVFGRVVTA